MEVSSGSESEDETQSAESEEESSSNTSSSSTSEEDTSASSTDASTSHTHPRQSISGSTGSFRTGAVPPPPLLQHPQAQHPQTANRSAMSANALHPPGAAAAPNPVVGPAADAVNHPKEVPPVKVAPQRASSQRHNPPPHHQHSNSSYDPPPPHSSSLHQPPPPSQQYNQSQPMNPQPQPASNAAVQPAQKKKAWNPFAKKPLTRTQYDAKIQKHQASSERERDLAESAAGRRNQNTATLHNGNASFGQRFTSFFKRISNWSAEKRHHRSHSSEEKKVRTITNERDKYIGNQPAYNPY